MHATASESLSSQTTPAVPLAPWEELAALEAAITKAVPPIDPPACHWLDSDAGPSYCHTHAWEARWKQLPSFGDCPPVPDWFRRSPLEEIMADGIDGCAGMGGQSDSPEACETCGCTLEYLLTDHGREEELDHYTRDRIMPGDAITGETTYALSRIFMNLDYPGAPADQVDAALTLARDVLAALEVQQASNTA